MSRCVRHRQPAIPSYLAAGMSEAEILSDFPYLTVDHIRACLAFAAQRKRLTVLVPA